MQMNGMRITQWCGSLFEVNRLATEEISAVAGERGDSPEVLACCAAPMTTKCTFSELTSGVFAEYHRHSPANASSSRMPTIWGEPKRAVAPVRVIGSRSSQNFRHSL